MSTDTAFTAAERAVWWALFPLPADMDAVIAGEEDWRADSNVEDLEWELPGDWEEVMAEMDAQPPFPPRAPRAAPPARASAGGSESAPTVVEDESDDDNDDDDDDDGKWAFLKKHMPNASGTYYSYSAKPGGHNRASGDRKVTVLMGGGKNQAFEQKSVNTFGRQDVPVLQRMARHARVSCHTSTVKKELAAAIIEIEKPLRPDTSGQGARSKKKSGGGVRSDGAWFVGRQEGGQLQMRKCSRAEMEKAKTKLEE